MIPSSMTAPETTERAPIKRAPRAPAPSLVVLYAPQGASRTSIDVDVPRTIGRAGGGADLELNDNRVSRLHVTVTRAGSGVVLLDSSTNGTFVEGRRVQSATAEDGDVVRVGESFLLVRAEHDDADDADVPGLSGVSRAMRALRTEVALVARSMAPVVILGESGTGKELVARAIHALSKRPGELVPVNCAAIPETLAESTLFGHVAGSFTGAKSDSPGLFRAAHRGTLFLDEIGEIPAVVSAKLLRVLEDGVVAPVGSTRGTPVDVRVVAATHRELGADVVSGKFRGDLYARLAAIVVRTPPLRERREDILPLLTRALEGAGHDARVPLDGDLVEALLLHPWRFNVRELLRVAEELALRGRGKARLDLELVASRLEPLARDEASAPVSERPSDGPDQESPSAEQVRELWERHGGNVTRIARALGRSRRQVARYLDAQGLRAKD